MNVKLNARAARTAKDLAVCYHAYLNAKDDLDVRVWGQMLLEAQTTSGVEMLDPGRIQRHIAASARVAGIEARRTA